jgi:hypothetical protein
MLDKKLINKISLQEDEEVIEDILKGNGYKDPMVKRRQYDNGDIRIAIIVEHGKVEDIWVYPSGNIKQKTITQDKPKGTPVVEPKKVAPLPAEGEEFDVEKHLDEQRTDVYVGDSSKLHGKVLRKDGDGKPVYDSYMQNEGCRITQLLAALARLESDKRDSRPMTRHEQQHVRMVNHTHRNRDK